MLETKESVPMLQLLVAVAKSDGKIEGAEKDAIEDSFKELSLPTGYSVERLLTEDVALDAILNQITSDEAKKSAFSSAYLLARADGAYTEPEKKLIQTLQTRFNISDKEIKELELELVVVDTPVETTIVSAVAPPERAARANDLRRKYCILTALAGAIPVPVIGDLMVIPMQLKMVYELGKVYGQDATKDKIKNILATLGVGTGARIAVSSISKLVPGWGSFVGATTAFATTYAIGHVATRHFESGVPVETLKTEFKQKKEEGKREYESQKSEIEAKKEIATRLETLGKGLKEGRITQSEYDRSVSEIAWKV